MSSPDHRPLGLCKHVQVLATPGLVPMDPVRSLEEAAAAAANHQPSIKDRVFIDDPNESFLDMAPLIPARILEGSNDDASEGGDGCQCDSEMPQLDDKVDNEVELGKFCGRALLIND
jgi:hypothetical protein